MIVQTTQEFPKDAIDQAVTILKRGGLIAFPTETYYGLGIDPFNEDALNRLFAVKKRSVLKPVLVLIEGRKQLDIFIDGIPTQYEILMENFWPGPLTLIFPAKPDISSLLAGGTGTIGVRQSPHPVAAALTMAFGGPVTATSANRSGLTPATSAQEVYDAFGSDIDLILDGGNTPGGLGSTLIGSKSGSIICLRDGCLPYEEIKKIL